MVILSFSTLEFFAVLFADKIDNDFVSYLSFLLRNFLFGVSFADVLDDFVNI